MKLPPGYVAGVGVPKATAYGGLGQRLMEKMGWSKGQGLGKDKHGIKDAIEVKKKDDTVGVGGKVASWDWDRKYWDDAYNSAIQSVAHIAASGSSSSDSSSSDSSSDSDTDSGGRGGRRGRRVKRTPTSTTSAPGTTTVVNRDGTLASASAAELKIAAELAKDPWGRWGGRAGKMARIRAQEQEEANRARAKLGLPPLLVPSAAPARAAESESSSDSDSSASKGAGSDSDGSGGRGNKRKQKDRAEEGKGKKGGEAAGKAGGSKRKRWRSEDVNGSGEGPEVEVATHPAKPAPKRLVVVLGSDAAVAARARMFATFKRTPATGWWGAKMFASAGLLESLEDEAAGDAALEAGAARQAAEAAEGRVALSGAAAVAAGQRKGFNEQDQEALYKRAQDLQRVGRRGLGKGEIKVGGAKWEGTKKTFGDDDDEDAEGDGKKDVDGDKEELVAAAAPEAEMKVEEEEGGLGDRKERQKDKKKNKKDREQRQEGKQDEDKGGKKSGASSAEAVVGRKPGASREAAVADAGAEEAAEAAPPKPKWLKLARMVVKKSAERRVKLRHVVSELLAAVEEQHRQHHEAHKQHHHHQHKKARKRKSDKGASGTQDGGGGPEGDGNNTADGSPWDAGTVREALEKKIRKSNSGLAIDGKFLTLVAAADG